MGVLTAQHEMFQALFPSLEGEGPGGEATAHILVVFVVLVLKMVKRQR